MNPMAWVRGRSTAFPSPLGRREWLATPLTQAFRVIKGGGVLGHGPTLLLSHFCQTQGIAHGSMHQEYVVEGRLGWGVGHPERSLSIYQIFH